MTELTLDLPPVVLLPGMQCTPALYQALTAALRATLPDVEVHTRTVAADSHEEAVAAALSALESPAVLVGHSLGGNVAMAAARLQPKSVAGVVTICSNPRAPRPEQIDQWRSQRDLAAGPSALGEEERLVRMLVGGPEEHDTDRYTAAVLTCREMIRATTPSTLIAQLTLQSSRIDERPTLARFTGPLLAIGASDDLMVPPNAAQEIADSARRGTATVLTDATHMAPLMKPELLASSVARWLGDQFGFPRNTTHLDTAARRLT